MLLTCEVLRLNAEIDCVQGMVRMSKSSVFEGNCMKIQVFPIGKACFCFVLLVKNSFLPLTLQKNRALAGPIPVKFDFMNVSGFMR